MEVALGVFYEGCFYLLSTKSLSPSISRMPPFIIYSVTPFDETID